MAMAVEGAEIDRSALIIVDMQNDLLHRDGSFCHIAREHPEFNIDMPFLIGTIPRTKQSRATALDPAAVRRHMNPAAGPARTSALVATTSCCCPDWRDLDGKAKVLDAADEAKDLLAFRTAVEMVGAEVLVQSAVL